MGVLRMGKMGVGGGQMLVEQTCKEEYESGVARIDVIKKYFFFNMCTATTTTFQDDDKEEMKEILEMKRRHERHVKKRKEKLQAMASVTSANIQTKIP